MSGLETKTLVPVIAPTEFVRVDQDRPIEVAQWLAERGIQCEVVFGKNGEATLWRPGALGRSPAEPGTWLGVQNGQFRGPFTDEQLANWQPVEGGAQ